MPVMRDIDPTDSTPPKMPQYADLHFPKDKHNTSTSSDDKPKPKPRPVPRHQSQESPYATTDVVNGNPQPEPNKRRPRPRARPKSTANLVDLSSQGDTTDSSFDGAPPKKKVTVKRNESLLRSNSRDALNDLTLDTAQDSFKDVKGRLAEIMNAQTKSGQPTRASMKVPIVHPRAAPKSILKKPKQQFYPTLQEMQQIPQHHNGELPSAAGFGAGTTV